MKGDGRGLGTESLLDVRQASSSVWCDSSRQGLSLFEDTEFGEELSDLGTVATGYLGDIRRACESEEADRRISDGGHYLGTGTLSDPACILPERDVTHVMATILDRPVASCPLEQLTCARELPRSAGDEVAGLA